MCGSQSVVLVRALNVSSSAGQAKETTLQGVKVGGNNATVAGTAVAVTGTTPSATVELQGSSDEGVTWRVLTSATVTAVGTFRFTQSSLADGHVRVAIRVTSTDGFFRFEDVAVTFVTL